MSPRQQRCAVAAAIVGAHALVVLVLVYTMQVLQGGTRLAAEPRLLYITELPLPATAAGPRGAAPGRNPTGHPVAPSAPAAARSLAAPITLSREQARIDWDLEAEVAADDWLADLARHDTRKCDDSDKPGSWLPKCRTHRSSFEWSAEPKRAGFENGLPYLRLGRRCILVLGMIGCALGAAPPANGHLFDDLRDPDWERSSVPDIATINEPVDLAPRHPSVLLDPAAPPDVARH